MSASCPNCTADTEPADQFCETCGYDFTSVATAWFVEARADRAYYDRLAPAGIDFPADLPPRHFRLDGDEATIGRRSAKRGIHPTIDLSGAPEDPAISHLHAILRRQPTGGYALVDPGSTNGTTLNDGNEPVASNVGIDLADGDRIHIGAWTTLTVRSEPSRPEPATQTDSAAG